MRTEELREVLAGVGLADALDGTDLGAVARGASIRSFARGATLWRAGTASRGLHVVLTGRIRVVRAREGRQHLVHVSRPGDTMGEAALFGAGVYPATAIAAEPSSCLVLPTPPLLDLLGRDPRFAKLLLERVARRTGYLVDRLEEQTLGPVRARVARALLALASESVDGHARIGESQASWAEALGTVREVLARELRVLRDEGLVEKVEARSYRIVDPPGLEAIATGRREPR